ncbi:MAG: ankyrin repeat domain-containing protein [Vulcanimicrobiota bacterium]
MPGICLYCGEKISEGLSRCNSCGKDITHDHTILDNRYEIISVIKSGAMGCVYRARDKRLNTIVALKKMISHFTNPEENAYVEQRFREEARILSQLHHGGLPKVIDFFSAMDPSTQDMVHYLVMTYIDGKDFDTIIEERSREPYPVDEALDYIRQILSILNYLHTQNPPVIYRDLKPSNIMLQNGKVFLVDFGVARLFDPQQKGTLMVIGTPGFAPPEQFRGSAEPRSDIYSLGVVIHYFLTGQDPQDYVKSLFTFEDPRSIVPDIPEYLAEIIMSMLEIVPDQRPSSVQYLLDLLKSPASLTMEKKYATIFDAVENNDSEAVKNYISRGVPVSERDSDGMTPLHYAVLKGHSMMAQLLISLDAEVNRTDSNGLAPLHCAAREGHSVIVELLLSNKASVNISTYEGLTPLHMASYGGHSIVAGLLLSRGAYVNSTAHDGSTPLHAAVDKGHKSIAEMLLDKGADVNARAQNGWTPLHLSACYGFESLTELLISRGANVAAKNDFGWTPLHWSVDRGHIENVQVLLSKNADINARTKGGSTPLHWACKKGQRDIAELLIARGADIKIQDNEGWTPLHIAGESGDQEIANLLLQRGSETEARDRCGRTPRQLAEEKRYWEVSEVLGKTAVKDTRRYRDIFEAIEGNDSEAVTRFINSGYHLNSKNYDGWTALHRAVDKGHKEIVKLLLSHGADIQIVTFKSSTPLHWAVKRGHRDVVELLIASGADPHAKTYEGKTPLQIAEDKGYGELIPLLQNAQRGKNAEPVLAQAPSSLPRESAAAESAAAYQKRETTLPGKAAEPALRNAVIPTIMPPASSMPVQPAKTEPQTDSSPVKTPARILPKMIPIPLLSSEESPDGATEQQMTPQAGTQSQQLTLRRPQAQQPQTQAQQRPQAQQQPQAPQPAPPSVPPRSTRRYKDIFEAIARNDSDGISRFITAGINLNSKNYDGWTPLLWAADKGNSEAAALLLQHGSEINGRSFRGATPLHWASKKGNTTLMKLLISKGADLHAVDDNGATPLSLAIERGKDDAARLLKSSGARQ